VSTTTGFVVGKFLPPHLGHEHLLRVAAAGCDELHVFAVWRAEEPIPGHLRAAWLRELVPGAVVHEIEDDLGPDDPVGWAANVRTVLGFAPDRVFTSETYGDRFAAELGAEHVCVDLDRATFPVSGTAVRDDPYGCWSLLPAPVRAWFTVRVAVVGAESTGTTTLARDLADHLRTAWVPEHGRPFSARKVAEGTRDTWTTPEFVTIARTQAADEDAAARRSGPVLVCDTDAMTTGIWHERYLGARCEEVDRLGASRTYDLYLLTGDEIPWVDDGTRDGRHVRAGMQQRFREALADRTEPWVELHGDRATRLAAAIEQVEGVLALPWTARHRIRTAGPHRLDEEAYR
jgi:HTH-type transcriptional repressor of NAD biosynthesis genes